MAFLLMLHYLRAQGLDHDDQIIPITILEIRIFLQSVGLVDELGEGCIFLPLLLELRHQLLVGRVLAAIFLCRLFELLFQLGYLGFQLLAVYFPLLYITPQSLVIFMQHCILRLELDKILLKDGNLRPIFGNLIDSTFDKLGHIDSLLELALGGEIGEVVEIFETTY